MGFVFSSLFSFSQLKPQFTQYIYNGFLLNPGLSGIEDYTDLKVGFRDQWTGIPDAPKTFFFTANGPLANQNHQQNPTSLASSTEGITSEEGLESMQPHHGIGFMAIGDKYGPFSQISVDLTYAYHLPLSNQTSLAAGISAGIYEWSLNAGSLTLPNGTAIDPALKSSSRINPDLNFGLWLYGHRYFLGASVLGIIPVNLSPVSGSHATYSSRNYTFTAGYKLYLTEDLALLPSVLWKYISPDPSSLDINLKASYRDRIWLGLSLRNQNAYSILAGVNISSHYNIGYSYDYTTSSLGNYSGGTHEIFIGLLLNNDHHHLCPRNVW